MVNDNNIKNFTGADIEKYHKGLLSAKERHDLEKAALDDPFLADALEGYAIAGVNHSADIIDLKKRLSDKVEAGKVIVMKTGGKNSFPWLRAAALVVIIAGAALLANQLIFKGDKKNIAQADTFKKEEIRPVETAPTGKISPEGETLSVNPGTVTIPFKQKEQTSASASVDNESDGAISKNANGMGKLTRSDSAVTINSPQPVAVAPVKVEDEQINQLKAVTANKEIKDVARDEVKYKNETGKKDNMDGDVANDKISKQTEERQNIKGVAASRKVAENQKSGPATNMFRGRVTDANNVGLPYARVYNPADNNAGTYTDVAGNFNLTYPDTVLTVQVKSVGFENVNVQLRNGVANNRVILQDDRSLAAQTIPSPRKINTEERSKMANVKLEEPEPADGWENYDTYIVNNLNPPEEIKTKKNAGGEVEVSFEVDKNGEPINITVEKSLCPKCDQEAIRLIKEGPKFKRKAKKGRTTVIVPF